MQGGTGAVWNHEWTRMSTNQGGGDWFEPRIDTNETRIRVVGVGFNHESTRMDTNQGGGDSFEPRIDTNEHESGRRGLV